MAADTDIPPAAPVEIHVAIGALNKLVVEPKEDTVWFVEVPDVHFNHNSAIPCLDDKGYLLAALVTTFGYAQEQTNKRLVLFGHTDTSGEIAYNYDLSDLRAKAVKAILAQDKTTWDAIAANKSQVLDYQTILKNLTFRHGWQCDPGELDNKSGPTTQAAVKAFQARAKQIYNIDLTVCVTAGLIPKPWGMPLGWLTVAAMATQTVRSTPDLCKTYCKMKCCATAQKLGPIDA